MLRPSKDIKKQSGKIIKWLYAINAVKKANSG